MKQKNRSYCTLMLCGAIWFTACQASSENEGQLEGPAPYTLALQVQGPPSEQTRTEVFDPNDATLRGRQHVTRVQLAIYEQDATGTDYTCVATENIGWKHLQGTREGLETRWQTYTTQYQQYTDTKTYRFVAMGFDDTFSGSITAPIFDQANSVAAYGTPEQVVKIGQKLSASTYSLQPQAHPQQIQHSEVFAGSESFTREELKNGTAAGKPIQLYRRVAGVIGYFKNLPAEINGQPVTQVELQLYTAQNTQVSILPKLPKGYSVPVQVPDPQYADFLTSPYTGTAQQSGKILAQYTVAPTPENRFTLSGYVLPIAPAGQSKASTLALVMKGHNQQILATRRILYKQPATDTRQGTGIIDGSGKIFVNYPLRANQFYRIGRKDQPVDVSGTQSEIYLQLDPIWDEYYGGAMEGTHSDIGLDKEWGEHAGGTLNGHTSPSDSKNNQIYKKH